MAASLEAPHQSVPERGVLRPRPHAARRGQRPGLLEAHARRRADVGRVDPGRGAALRAVQPRRRDAAVDGARPPGRHARPRAGRQAAVQAAAAGGRRACLLDHGAALRRAGHRRAPARRAAPGRAGHDHAVRPGEAAGRAARLRRRGRHPLRRQRATAPTTARSTARSCGATGKLDGRAGVGRRARRRPAGELRLLRQLLRRAAALGRRPPGRREPRPAAAARGRRPALADRCHLDVPPGVPKLPLLGLEPQQRRAGLRPAADSCPYARFDIAGVEHIPTDGPGDHRRQPPQLLRRRWRWRCRSPAAGRTGALPRQEGGVRRARRRPAGQGDGRHPRRAGHRLRRAAAGRGRGARRPASWWRSCPRARSRAARRSSTPS